MKNNTYRFTSDVEPTDKELELLMDEFTKDVKNRILYIYKSID